MAEEEKKPIEAWEKELKKLAEAEEWERLGQRADICIEQYPESKAGYFFRGNAKVSLSLYKEAIPDFDKAIEIKDKNKNAYMYRGIVKASLEKYEDSILDFDKVIEIDESSEA